MEGIMPESEILSVPESADYMADYEARKESGIASPVDIANAAYMRAEQAVGVLTGDQENTSRDKRAAYYASANRVRELAALTARLFRAGMEVAAYTAAAKAEAAAVTVDAFDSARLEGLPRETVFADGRGRSARHYNR